MMKSIGSRHRTGIILLLTILVVFYVLPSQQIYGSEVETFKYEEDFLEWYEQHKDVGGECNLTSRFMFALGDSRDPSDPVRLDGSGNIKINSNVTIDICGTVILDNPNLEINVKDILGILIQSEAAELILKNGTLNVDGIDGISLYEGVLRSEESESVSEGELRAGPVHSPATPSSAAILMEASPSDADLADTSLMEASPSDANLSDSDLFDTGSIHDLGAERAEDSSFNINVTLNSEDMSTNGTATGITRNMLIYFEDYADIKLSNLNITVSGDICYGILQSNGTLSLTNCSIYAAGKKNAYGILSKNDVYLTDSQVVAAAPTGAALYCTEGRIDYDQSSCVITEPEKIIPLSYYIANAQNTASSDPLAAAVNTNSGQLLLPQSMELDICHPLDGYDVSDIGISSWDLSSVKLDKAGIYTAVGRLNEADLQVKGITNILDSIVTQEIIVLDDTGTFIEDIILDDTWAEQDHMMVLRVYCMYPPEARELYVEYKVDGENWIIGADGAGRSNFMDENGPYWPNNVGRFTPNIEIPYVSGKVEVRLRTIGGGLFEGTGRVSKVDLDTGEITEVEAPGSKDDDTGGDRGGGDSDTVTRPTQAPNELPPNPGPGVHLPDPDAAISGEMNGAEAAEERQSAITGGQSDQKNPGLNEDSTRTRGKEKSSRSDYSSHPAVAVGKTDVPSSEAYITEAEAEVQSSVTGAQPQNNTDLEEHLPQESQDVNTGVNSNLNGNRGASDGRPTAAQFAATAVVIALLFVVCAYCVRRVTGHMK